MTRSTFEYEEERNENLLRAFYERCKATPSAQVSTIISDTVGMPSDRFYVSDERAARVINALLQGREYPKMLPTHRQMYAEILRRVIELREVHPHWCVMQLVRQVLRTPAPQFYLTPSSAYTIIQRHRHRRGRRTEEQMRRRAAHIISEPAHYTSVASHDAESVIAP